MKPTRASILSKTEEQFLVTRMSVLRKQQLKTLPDNKILHDFLTCVSPEKTLIAYEDTNSKNRISWHISEGFKLELEDSFFECPDKLQKAYEAVRRCFFEDFLDEDDYTELGNQSVPLNIKENLHDNLPSSNETEGQIELPEDNMDEDAMDLLDKVNDLDANTLSSDDEEVQADEFSNLSSNEDSPGSPEAEANTNETVKSEEQEVSQNLVSNEEDKTETIEVEESEEPQTKTTETEESEEPQTETTETEEVTEEPISEQEKEDQTGPDFDDLAKQLTEVGMEEDKIDSLLSAVRSGKAPLETVQATIDKLRAAQE